MIRITMVRGFVQASGPATIEDVLDHIDHVAKLVGVEHVGIGSDVDLNGRDAHIRPASASIWIASTTRGKSSILPND